MRIPTVLAAALFASTLAGSTGAQAAAWCAWYNAYTYNCGFYTFEQCQYSVIGSGGACARNVYEPGPPPAAAAPVRKHRKYRRAN